MKKTFPILALLLVILTACPKKKDQMADNATTPQLVADSAYLYTKEVYFWNTLPGIGTYESFNPRKFANSDLVKTADDLIKSIRALQPADQFSNAISSEQSDQIITGDGTSWGFWVKSGLVALPANDANNTRWFIPYVYAGSDAGSKGVRRGWILNKLNGSEIRGDQASVDKLNALFFGTATSANVEFIKPDGTTQSISLSKTRFTENPVLYSTIYTNGSKKIGYIVFNTFLGTQAALNDLLAVFDNFIGQGVNELIIDLRENLGGSTVMQDRFANILVPASKTGQTMYRYEFNQQLQQGNFPLVKKKLRIPNNDYFSVSTNTETFAKIRTLALSRVFFIVTENTASSSELLINNLKPVMDVKLIGEKNTHGKPVGYFPIELFDKVALYPVSFKTVNSVGAEVPYEGFAPDKIVVDGINKDWGDVTEPCLANALNYINTGNFLATSPATSLKTTTSRSVVSGKLDQLNERRTKNVGIYYEHKNR
ncbi:S41 family peptidase [Niabella yanshanensis]|uniref:S41 family peptidase n=1 Tax=Niabella yanshanensis TaxID=577386 RepID=A0ABZ0WAD4_9BACT|nr:S41 family peptidase [Niabella yanshanensis]WQD40111.1 S41 family peptidase [Niabella yanshanensis]